MTETLIHPSEQIVSHIGTALLVRTPDRWSLRFANRNGAPRYIHWREGGAADALSAALDHGCENEQDVRAVFEAAA